MLPWKSLHLLFAVSMVFSIASAFDREHLLGVLLCIATKSSACTHSDLLFTACKINNGGCRPGQICVPRQPEIVCIRPPCDPDMPFLNQWNVHLIGIILYYVSLTTRSSACAHSDLLDIIFTVEPSLLRNPCTNKRCPIGYRCEVDTGEAVCYPDCKLNNGGCLPGQICTLRQVQCIRAPCVPIRQCIKFKGGF